MQMEQGGNEDAGIEGSCHSFVSLFETKVWLERDSLCMPAEMAEAEGGKGTAALELG
jgi:hypothetical protein